ncbi:MAG: hypothetical protein ACO3AC_08910 [Hylemonella sp.]
MKQASSGFDQSLAGAMSSHSSAGYPDRHQHLAELERPGLLQLIVHPYRQRP